MAKNVNNEAIKLSNLTQNDLKIKIKNIKTNYNKELSKLFKSKKSGIGTNDIYKPGLRWFEQANTFLKPVTEARPIQSNLVSIINSIYKYKYKYNNIFIFIFTCKLN